MLITSIQAEAARECLQHNIPFAIYAMPNGDEHTVFMASLPDADGESHAGLDTDRECFFISRFTSDEPYISGIMASMDAEGVLDYLAQHPDTRYYECVERPYLTSTRRISYNEAFRMMTRRLKKAGGKVVLSRHESLFSTGDIIDTTRRYFSLHPEAFRYMSFTPETGLWLGATPELLLATNVSEPDKIYSMALAGTYPDETDNKPNWDVKNILEHDVVVNFITDTLSSHGLEVSKSQTHELHSGKIIHLCTPITAIGNTSDISTIINDLNPTPAVAGWPKSLAIAEIDAFETHQRRCYSGIVGVKTDTGLRVYVNLRCAFAAKATVSNAKGWIYNIYAGGGLMPDSNLDSEWSETERKMAGLIECMPDAIHNPVTAQF